jgi:uroporphyrinogen-III decarboxylase
MEQPEFARRIMDLHENAQLDLVRQTASGGVKVIMSMDNLDTMFQPPEYVEAYSASFYEKASAICHEHGAKFFIHACGGQKSNLKLINSLNVDGLEGVAFPPLGDVELDEAMRMTSDNFIITGGISAFETKDLKTKKEVFTYVENLFTRLKPYKNRFIFSSSCNTAIDASWETIKNFRDAWLEYRD